MAHDHQHHDHHQHHEAHGHTHTDLDWAEQGPMLEAQAELYTPAYEQAIAWLAEAVPAPELIVDAGSGPGVVACLFAEAFPQAHVVAVDGAAPLLERARARAEQRGLGDRFSTLTGELPDVLEKLDRPVDLLWASRSLHHLGDQQAALTTFGEHLAPGGTLALLEGGLPARFLPRDIGIGRPGLQSRLTALEEEWFGRMRAGLSGAVSETEDWRALLTAAGLRPTRTRSFLLDLPAPATHEARAHVATTLTRLRDAAPDDLTPEDRTTLDRLLNPTDPAGVHHRPDVFVLDACTIHTAVRPA
ncbi:class I SAM-dependent methyltransferase [Streptomyces sp. NPDC004549]|uniref:class I SAM-dependent methyltransferase n=1 Tax=Streptomyces sp. NPDC004549 TaxID=3154283 RepID=UPI0033A4AC42